MEKLVVKERITNLTRPEAMRMVIDSVGKPLYLFPAFAEEPSTKKECIEYLEKWKKEYCHALDYICAELVTTDAGELIALYGSGNGFKSVMIATCRCDHNPYSGGLIYLD